MIDISLWMDAFLQALHTSFENRIRFAGLQGSYGRGEATETSDIDVVVIQDRLDAAEAMCPPEEAAQKGVQVCYVNTSGVEDPAALLLEIIISVNITLMVFNLLPIPPLDGSRLWSSLLPGRWAYTLEQYSRYITLGLMVLIFVGALDLPLYWMRAGVYALLNLLTGWISFLV